MMSAIYFGVLLYLPQFMIKELEYSAAQSGAGLLPLMGMFAIMSFVGGSLYNIIGPKLVISLGAICLGVGIFILADIGKATTFLEIVPGMLVVGTGVGLFYSAITTAGIMSLDPMRASLAGAVIFMFQNAGGSIGLGLSTAIVVSAPSFSDGIFRAFAMDSVFAIGGLIICLLFVAGALNKETLFPWLISKNEAE
jgi:MFS family permease